jgi:hypothetical protein
MSAAARRDDPADWCKAVMLHARYVFVAAAIVLGGCGGKRSDPACRASADELTRFLNAMDHDVSVVWTDELRLVTRDDLPKGPTFHAPILKLGPTTIVFQSEFIDGRAELAERLTVTYEQTADHFRKYPQHDLPAASDLHLVIDEAVAWETVVWVVETLHEARFDAPFFVFARPPATPPPPRTWLDDELDRMHTANLSDGRAAASGLRSRVLRSCGAITRAFESTAAVEGDKVEHLIRAIGPALVQCNCDVDLAALRTLMWRLAGNPHPTSALRIALARDASGIALPAATPWREASQRLAPTTTPAWFAIAQ